MVCETRRSHGSGGLKLPNRSIGGTTCGMQATFTMRNRRDEEWALLLLFMPAERRLGRPLRSRLSRRLVSRKMVSLSWTPIGCPLADTACRFKHLGRPGSATTAGSHLLPAPASAAHSPPPPLDAPGAVIVLLPIEAGRRIVPSYGPK